MAETRLYFYCACGAILNAAEGSGARAGECPACGKIIIIPDDAFAMPIAAPRAESEAVPVRKVVEPPEEVAELADIEEVTDEMIEEVPGDEPIGEMPVGAEGAEGIEEAGEFEEVVEEAVYIARPDGLDREFDEAAEVRIERSPAPDFETEVEAADGAPDFLPDRAGAEVLIDFGGVPAEEPEQRFELEEEFEEEEFEEEETEEEEIEEEEEIDEEPVRPSQSTRRMDRGGRTRPPTASAKTGTAARRRGSRRDQADEGRVRSRPPRRGARPDRRKRGEEGPAANIGLIVAIVAVLLAAAAVAVYVIMK